MSDIALAGFHQFRRPLALLDHMVMTEGIRVLLVDVHEESRRHLLDQMGQMWQVWVTEVCVAYPVAARRAAEIKPDLTLIVASGDGREAAAVIRSIRESDPEAKILAACRASDTQASSNLTSSGALEIVTLPIENQALLQTIRRMTRGEEAAPVPAPAPTPVSNPAPTKASAAGLPAHHHAPPLPRSSQTPKTIAVTGASGEVGCTTLAVNLATTLAKSTGKDVVLADFELMFGAVDTLLDIFPENTLVEIVRSVDRLDITLLKRMLCRHSSGLYVLPRPVELQEAARLDPDSLGGTLKLLQSSFAAVVLDTSKSLQTSDFIAFDAADVILVVVQLDLTSVRNTARLIHCMREFEGLADRIQIVANRVGSLRCSVSVKAAEEAFKMPIKWQLPNATRIYHAARDRGVPIEVIAPKSESQRIINTMARALIPSLPFIEAKPQRGFFRDRFQREG